MHRIYFRKRKQTDRFAQSERACKRKREWRSFQLLLVRLTGVEPAHMASEATALSTELQAHKYLLLIITDDISNNIYYTKKRKNMQEVEKLL